MDMILASLPNMAHTLLPQHPNLISHKIRNPPNPHIKLLLDQLLMHVLQLCMELKTFKLQQITTHANVIEADHHVSLVKLRIEDIDFTNVMVDGGFEVNILSNWLHLYIGILGLENNDCIVIMANLSKVNPWGVFMSIKTTIHNINVLVIFTVLDLPEEMQYMVILGRPWLRDTNAAHD